MLVRQFEASMWYLSLKKRVEDMASLEAGKSVKARIVAIDYATRQIYLSNTETVMNPSYTPQLQAIGSVHEDGEVVAIDENRGMLLSPNVYVREKQLSDQEGANVQKLFEVGQKNVRYRIIDHDLLDNLVFVPLSGGVNRRRRRRSRSWSPRC